MSEENYIAISKLNIVDCDPDELAGIVSSCGDKQFRAKQIFGWISKGVEYFDEMTNIPAKLGMLYLRDIILGFQRLFWFKSLSRMVLGSAYLNFKMELVLNQCS